MIEAKMIQPDVLVKGGDYEGKEVVGTEFAKELKLVDFVDGKSTTRTIERIKKDSKPDIPQVSVECTLNKTAPGPGLHGNQPGDPPCNCRHDQNRTHCNQDDRHIHLAAQVGPGYGGKNHGRDGKMKHQPVGLIEKFR